MIKFGSLTAALGLLLILSGCGSAKAPPEEYELGGEVFPALTQVVPPIDMSSVTYTPPEEEGTPYGYGGLPETAVADYAAALTETLGFSRMDEDCLRQENAADYTVPGHETFGRESGEVLAASGLGLGWRPVLCGTLFVGGEALARAQAEAADYGRGGCRSGAAGDEEAGPGWGDR